MCLEETFLLVQICIFIQFCRYSGDVAHQIFIPLGFGLQMKLIARFEAGFPVLPHGVCFQTHEWICNNTKKATQRSSTLGRHLTNQTETN